MFQEQFAELQLPEASTDGGNQAQGVKRLCPHYSAELMEALLSEVLSSV